MHMEMMYMLSTRTCYLQQQCHPDLYFALDDMPQGMAAVFISLLLTGLLRYYTYGPLGSQIRSCMVPTSYGLTADAA